MGYLLRIELRLGVPQTLVLPLHHRHHLVELNDLLADNYYSSTFHVIACEIFLYGQHRISIPSKTNGRMASEARLELTHWESKSHHLPLVYSEILFISSMFTYIYNCYVRYFKYFCNISI